MIFTIRSESMFHQSESVTIDSIISIPQSYLQEEMRNATGSDKKSRGYLGVAEETSDFPLTLLCVDKRPSTEVTSFSSPIAGGLKAHFVKLCPCKKDCKSILTLLVIQAFHLIHLIQ